jgi:hypothetical protein
MNHRGQYGGVRVAASTGPVTSPSQVDRPAARATKPPRGNHDLPIPGALSWAYQAELNNQADILFWHDTNYKPGQRLNPADPRDRAMIPQWWAAHRRVEQGWSPRGLLRERASQAALNMQQSDPRPIILYSAGAGGSEMRSFDVGDRRADEIAHARLRDASYVAIFNANDPKFPRPTRSAAADRSRSHPGDTPRRSGEVPPTIDYEGLSLRPLSPEDAAEQVVALSHAPGDGWIDFEGRRQRRPRLLDVYRPGDVIYYWDGPWGVLSGSRGIAVVRNGNVVETFTTMVS